jgi:hypothetical protein
MLQEIGGFFVYKLVGFAIAVKLCVRVVPIHAVFLLYYLLVVYPWLSVNNIKSHTVARCPIIYDFVYKSM